jgi:hypothetical protein
MIKPHAHADPDRARSNRGMLGLVGTILVIVIVALMLLMIRGCDTGAGRDSGTNGGKEIVPVAGLSADPGVVSAWVANGSDISSVLRVAGLENATITDMGGGRFVITVPVGTEDTVVRILAEADGVYDAGRVYDLNK